MESGLKVTDVKVFPTYSQPQLKAWARVTLNDSFVIGDLKVIDGKSGLFLAMPCKKRPDGEFHDIVHPTNPETRKMIEDAVMERYLSMDL